MNIDPAREAIMLALANDVFEALIEADRQGECEVAEDLFRIWVQLPTDRSRPN